MNTWINNDSAGKYLYVETNSEEQGFEMNMIRSIVSPLILPAKLVFQNGTKCFECDISGYETLESYMSRREFGVSQITALLIQINNVAATVRKYLLTEGDIIIDSAFIFRSAETPEYKFCVIPGSNYHFEQEMKELVHKILMNLNTDDTEAMKLGLRMFQICEQKEYKLHELMELIGRKPAEECKAVPVYTDAVETEPEDPETVIEERYFDTESDLDTETEIPPVKQASGSLITGFLLAQGILAASVAVVFLLKGKELAWRLMPFYLILAACIVLYYITEGIMGKMKVRKKRR